MPVLEPVIQTRAPFHVIFRSDLFIGSEFAIGFHRDRDGLDLETAGYVEHEDEGSSFGNWYYPWSRDADPFVAYGPEEEGGTLAPSDSGKTAKELMAKGFVQATTEHATTAPTAPSLAPRSSRPAWTT